MSVLWWIVAGLLVWLVVALGIGVVIGLAIRRRDQQVPTESRLVVLDRPDPAAVAADDALLDTLARGQLPARSDWLTRLLGWWVREVREGETEALAQMQHRDQREGGRR